MTTIATDGRTIAGDTLITFGDERSQIPHTKIVVRNGYVVGFAGVAAFMEDAVAWFVGSRRPDECPVPTEGTWALVAVDREGRIYYVTSVVQRALMVAAPFAIGSGGEFALGAMFAGAPARAAVEIAAKLNIYTGGSISEIDIVQALSEQPMQQAAE